ncbi:hypothetical protein JTB14_014810 [Gonioctena quinquepunctata]|nr:hypothetical protein JTB14_014810 [Gonioctena quinquepunctata]
MNLDYVVGWDDILPLHKFGNKSYFLGNIFKGTYLQAAEFCHDVHMDLVSIESKEENTFLYELLQKDGGDIHFWSSGTRLIDGKNFIWLGTAKPIGYTNWQQGQPNDITRKCLGLELAKKKDLYWSDRDCNNLYNFVCEKEDKKVEKENEKNWPAIFENPNVSPNVNLLNFKDKSYYFNNHFLLLEIVFGLLEQSSWTIKLGFGYLLVKKSNILTGNLGYQIIKMQNAYN